MARGWTDDWHAITTATLGLGGWPERGTALGLGLYGLRLGWWLWRRKPGAPLPVFGWLGDLAATRSLLILATIRLKTATAQIARLEAEIEAAGIRSSADGSAGSSSASVGSTPTRSPPPTAGPSPTTSAKPGRSPT